MNDFLTDPRRGCKPCLDGTPNLLFTSDDHSEQEIAKRICRGCPFRSPCLRYAFATGERQNVWGGVLMSSEIERRHALRAVPQLDDQVHELWEQKLSDGRIGKILGVDKAVVRNSRHRQGLAALYGAHGKLLETEVAA